MLELIAWSPEKLVARAIELTSDLEKLAGLRATLRARLASLSPDGRRALRPRSRALYREEGRRGQKQDALAALLRAVTLKPDLVEAGHNLGLVLLEHGELDAAIGCFERVADLKPSLFANQRRLADALVLRGDLPRARGHYHCALILQPDSEYCRAAPGRVIKTLAQNHVQASTAPV